MSTARKTVHDVLTHIQANLKAPKGQLNKFGNYRYRSCEDILEALKPFLDEHHSTVTLTDTIELVGDRFYVHATAQLNYYDGHITTSAYAREALEKKGMDASQITAAASSYARKSALSGLLAIDDTKDADATNDHSSTTSQVSDKKIIELEAKITDNDLDMQKIKKWMKTTLKVDEFAQLNDQGYAQVLMMVNKKIEAIKNENN
jgi:hypothetical protein